MSEQSIFRKKNLNRISSPEDLNEYVKVTNPAIWVILLAAFLLLAGACVWGIFGRIDSKIVTSAQVENGKMTIYIKESDKDSVKKGMTVVVEGKKYKLTELSTEPVQMEEDTESYLMHIGSFSSGDWAYTSELSTDLEDGTYEADIITERISPMSFVTN